MMEFLNSKFGLLLSGFVLTTIAGGILNYLFQSAAWKRQQKYQLLANAIVEGRDLFDELTDLMNRRVFGLQRVYWVIKEEWEKRDPLPRFQEYLEPIDVISGLVKASVFGFLIALMGCYHGFHSRGGAQGVGAATTHAVVSASILILTTDYLLTELFFTK